MNKFDITNEYCMLVQFTNRGNELEVGFKNWIATPVELDRVAAYESLLTVEWSEETAIGEATQNFKNKLRAVQWAKHPVKTCSRS